MKLWEWLRRFQFEDKNDSQGEFVIDHDEGEIVLKYMEDDVDKTVDIDENIVDKNIVNTLEPETTDHIILNSINPHKKNVKLVEIDLIDSSTWKSVFSF